METLVASVDDHDRWADWPMQMVLGDAVMATDAKSTSDALAEVTGTNAVPIARPMRAAIITKPTLFDTVFCTFIVMKWL
jgi:hypothetical protein